tara:strand:- start:524 stop:2365 length:1842 start_codon:yes stop_codon:yes gene_type:complete
MSQWIAAISRGHNGSVCLLKDGEVVVNLEEERLTRFKYDGAPLACINLIKKYTDKLDYLVIVHTTRLEQHNFKMDYCGNDPYFGMARKLGLVESPRSLGFGEIPDNVIDMGQNHHRSHVAAAFYNSGFDKAVGVVVDGAGSWVKFGAEEKWMEDYWETETIFDCAYPDIFDTKYKHIGTALATPVCYYSQFDSGFWSGYGQGENYESSKNQYHELFATPNAGIVKTYEAVTEYCGFPAIEAGKVMGLFPYGKNPDYLPPFFQQIGDSPVMTSDRNIFTPHYPNGAIFNLHMMPHINQIEEDSKAYENQNRKDVAWRIQQETQHQVLRLIRKAVKETGHKNVVLTGGYGLNCVANYWYLEKLKDEGICLYVEPVSNDCGTALGAALLWHHRINQDTRQRKPITNLYLGPKYDYTDKEIEVTSEKYEAVIEEATHKTVVDLIQNKNIVALFQGRSEAGPRALGNRSFLYDPRDPDGKDHVNTIKKREFFRPFAGSILKEHVHEWFDLRGMDETPFMMYAVNCQPGIEEKIPAIIHVDKTCRIQTVTEEQNKHYYDIIKEWYDATGCPIIFNTSFNLGGEPLVETLDDAIRTLATSDVEYLYLPEYNKIIISKNEV